VIDYENPWNFRFQVYGRHRIGLIVQTSNKYC